jgi:hypothetical protein
MHFPRFGTERSEVRILSPRSMKSKTYGRRKMPVLLLRSHLRPHWDWKSIVVFSSILKQDYQHWYRDATKFYQYCADCFNSCSFRF